MKTNQLNRMNRRTALGAIAATPLAAAVPAVAKPDTTEQQLLALIGKLENAPDYEVGYTHYAKAFAAAEMRKIMGLPVPESNNLDGYNHTLKEQQEWGRKHDAMKVT